MHFEEKSEFAELLHIYNDQMLSVEEQNRNLIIELRKLAKVSANEIKAERSQEDSAKVALYEKNTRSMKSTIKKLSG